MKKITFLPILLILFFTGITSCKKQLDIANPNTIDESNFWQTSDDAVAGVNAIYGNNYRNGIYARWLAVINNPRSDDGLGSSGWDQIYTVCNFLIVNYDAEPVNHCWAHHWRGIYRANQVIANVPGITMDETLKKRCIAEAKFWRATYYYNLVNIWGNVPLILTPSAPTDLPTNAAPAAIWTQVEQDLNDAIPDLPTSYDNDNIGRITKGAAYAQLGKTYLQEHKYQQAADAFAWLVTGDGKSIYSLVTNYADNFSPTTENNRESVFEIDFKAQQSVTDEDDPNSNMGNQRSPFFGPGSVNGVNAGYNDLEMRRWVINEFEQEKTKDGNRDPRLAVTAIFDSTDERGPDYSTFWGSTFSNLLGNPNDNRCWYRKYENDQYATGITYEDEKNVRVIRYADVLLMYAECLNQLGQTSNAYQYVDMVRERAGLEDLSVVKPGLTQDAFQKQLEHERVTELTGEDVRWNDLARWGYFTDDTKLNELKARDAEFNNFVKGKNELLPIPQSEIDVNPNLHQNPGY